MLQEGLDALVGGCIDQGAYVGGELGGVAAAQLAGRPMQHLDHFVCNRRMHTQQSQRRAALPGAFEGALNRRIHHLLGQGAGVHHHGIDPAGLRDQGDDRAVFGGQRPVDDFGNLG